MLPLVLQLKLVERLHLVGLVFKEDVELLPSDAGLLLDLPELLGHDDAPGPLAGVLILVHLYFEVLLFRLLYLEDLLRLELPFHVIVSRDVDVQVLLLEV